MPTDYFRVESGLGSARPIAKVENDAALDAVKKSGKTTVYVPSKEERLAFKKACGIERGAAVNLAAPPQMNALKPFEIFR